MRFNCTEPSLSTALQGKQGVQDALIRGGSSPLIFIMVVTGFQEVQKAFKIVYKNTLTQYLQNGTIRFGGCS